MMRTIEVVPHDPEWAARFRKEAVALKGIFGEQMQDVHHIGSTAVPGLSAKPVIDILVEVGNIEEVDTLNETLVERGYLAKGEFGIPGRRFFVKGTEEDRSHNIHVFEAGSDCVAQHLNFRDYLIAHPREAESYGRLKEVLARQFPHDIMGYMRGKHDFIRDMLGKATEWKEAVSCGEVLGDGGRPCPGDRKEY
jgi:GrpB-like predicted nucleotidyltransferase (UPF0157 family)